MSGDEQRKVSLEELQAAIELFPHPICVTSEQKVVACNQAMLDAAGYAREELVGRPYADLLPPEERRRFSEKAYRRAQGEVLPDADIGLLRTRSGSVLPLQLSVSRQVCADGRPLSVVTAL